MTTDSFDRLLIGYKAHILHLIEFVSPDKKMFAIDLIQKSAKYSFSAIILFSAFIIFIVALISIFWILMNKKDKLPYNEKSY